MKIINKTRFYKRPWLIVLIISLFLIAGGLSTLVWYDYQLSPVDELNKESKTFVVADSSTFQQVADKLESEGLIRSSRAFMLYVRISGVGSNLMVGKCNLSPSQDGPEIASQITGNCTSRSYKPITFYPGATIERPIYKSKYAKNIDQDRMYVKGVLKRAGFSDGEIDMALKKKYTGDLFADKPAKSDLEGYVFGETYHVDNDASVEDILQTSFDEMDKQIKKHNLVEGFKKQGLNLYQGITMSSIVQRELNCEDKPTKQRKDRCYQYLRGIAQVFLKRYKEGQKLGSDVTFIYAADKMGVEPKVDLDSPYNTRIKTGLPPGPIASPGLMAMRAVADPAEANNVFFIAGDDGLIYFAKDNKGHQDNIRKHCQKLCGDL